MFDTRKTRIGLPSREEMTMFKAVFIEYRNVTDRQTDRQTDGRADGQNSYINIARQYADVARQYADTR